MSIKITSTYNNSQEIDTFINTLKAACLIIDTLAQIQAITGGMAMESKASHSFEVGANLSHYINQIRMNNK